MPSRCSSKTSLAGQQNETIQQLSCLSVISGPSVNLAHEILRKAFGFRNSLRQVVVHHVSNRFNGYVLLVRALPFQNGSRKVKNISKEINYEWPYVFVKVGSFR